MKRKKKEYTKELKVKIIKEYKETKETLEELSKRYNVPPTTISGWVGRYRINEDDEIIRVLGDKRKKKEKIPPVLYKEYGLEKKKEMAKEELIDELGTLMMENQILKEILKKTEKEE